MNGIAFRGAANSGFLNAFMGATLEQRAFDLHLGVRHFLLLPSSRQKPDAGTRPMAMPSAPSAFRAPEPDKAVGINAIRA
jgi:hypothetical protein